MFLGCITVLRQHKPNPTVQTPSCRLSPIRLIRQSNRPCYAWTPKVQDTYTLRYFDEYFGIPDDVFGTVDTVHRVGESPRMNGGKLVFFATDEHTADAQWTTGWIITLSDQGLMLNFE
jgi:hypothetical protein